MKIGSNMLILFSIVLVLGIHSLIFAETGIQLRASMDHQQGSSNVQVFDMEEFSVFDEQLPAKYKYLRGGQYANQVGDEPDPNVKVYPKLKSGKPIYGTVTFNHGLYYSNQFGTDYCFVLDESGGTSTGYDLFYFDLI